MSSFRAETQSGVRTAFSSVGRILLPTIAFAGITQGIRKSVEQAEIRQVLTGQLQNAFSTAGLSYRQYQAVVDTTIRSQEKLGFSFDDSATSLTRSIRATRNVNTALKLNAVAADLARGQNIGLLQATQILVRAFNGQSAGLKRLGVDVAKHAKGIQVLDAVEARFANSSSKYADTAAGSQQRLSAAISVTEASIGQALIPTVANLNTRLSDWLSNTERQKKLQHDVNSVVETGGHILHEFATAFALVEKPVGAVVHLLGGFENVAEKALVIGLLVKARQATAGLAGVSGAARTMGQTVAADSAEASAALAKTGAAGAKSMGLLDRALVGVGAKLAGLGPTAASAAAKISASAEAEARAVGGVGAAGLTTVAPVTSDSAALRAAGAAQAAAAATTTLEATQLDQTLQTIAASERTIVSGTTRDDATMFADRVKTIAGVGETGAARLKGVAKTEQASLGDVGRSSDVLAAKMRDDTAAGTAGFVELNETVAKTGEGMAAAGAAAGVAGETMSRSLAAPGVAATETAGKIASLAPAAESTVGPISAAMAKDAAAVDEVGLAATRSQGRLAGLRGVAGRGLVRAGGGVAAPTSALEGTLLTRGGLSGLARAGLGVATKAFDVGLVAYIGNSLVQSFTGVNLAGVLSKRVVGLFQQGPSNATLLGRDLQTLAALESKLGTASQGTSLAALKLERDTATQGVATAKAALAADHASATSVGYRTKLVALGDAQTALAEKNAAYQAGLKAAAKATSDIAKRSLDAGQGEHKFADALFQSHGALVLAAAAGRANANTLFQTHGALTQTGQATQSSAAQWVQWKTQVEGASASAKNLPPVMQHNIDLLLEFGRREQQAGVSYQAFRAELQKAIHLFIDNTDAKRSLDDLLAYARKDILSFTSAVGTGLSRAFQTAAQRANEQQVGGKSLPKVFQFGALKKLDLARLKVEGGKNQTAIRDAARAELDQVNKTITFLEHQHPTSKKALKALGDNLANFYGQRSSLQSEIDGIDQAASSKAKTLRDAARRKAKTAAAKAAHDYQSGISDQESSLKRAASTARAAALRVAGLGRSAVADQKKLFVLPGDNKGLLTPGNIDLLHRKVAHLAGGDIATVHSFSVSTDKGETLLSQVINGKLVSMKKAIENFRKTGENLGVFKTIADANAYAERLHLEQAKVYLNEGKTATPPPGLLAKVRAADQAEIAFYQREAKDAKLGASARRHYAGLAVAARQQETKDIAAVGAAETKARDDGLSLQISQAQLAIKEGRGSAAHLARLQDQQEALERKALRDQIARDTRRANNAKLAVSVRNAASQAANAAEDKLLALGATDASRQEKALSLAVAQAENAVKAAQNSGDQAKLTAAETARTKALKLLIAFDAKEAKDLGISADARATYKDKAAAARKKLLDQTKAGSTGFTLSQLFEEASKEFATYGSNIGQAGTPLSPQDERAQFAEMVGHLARSQRVKKQTPIVIQHFSGDRNIFQTAREARQAAQHLLAGA